MTTANFTARDASIATQSAQKVAAKLLRLELELKAWELPSKEADRLEAIEARYDALVKKLMSAALLPYVSAIDVDVPGEPKQTEPTAGAAGDLVQDEFSDDIPY